MAVTFNEGFNLYEGPIAERPTPDAAYADALFRATDTKVVYRCEDHPPTVGFSYQGNNGYYWNEASIHFFSQTDVLAGDTISNTASATFFDTSFLILGGTLVPGSVMRVTAVFNYTSKAAGPGTLTIDLLTNTTHAVLAGTAFTLPDGATGNDLILNGIITMPDPNIRNAEARGFMVDSGQGTIMKVSQGAGANFTPSDDQEFAMRATFSLADVDNAVTMRQYIIEILSNTPGV